MKQERPSPGALYEITFVYVTREYQAAEAKALVVCDRERAGDSPGFIYFECKEDFSPQDLPDSDWFMKKGYRFAITPGNFPVRLVSKHYVEYLIYKPYQP